MAGSAQLGKACWSPVRQQEVTVFSLRDVPGVPHTAPPGTTAFLTMAQCTHDVKFWYEHNPALIVNVSGRQDVFFVFGYCTTLFFEIHGMVSCMVVCLGVWRLFLYLRGRQVP